MRRAWRPLLVGGAVAAGTFALAQAQVFAPSAPAGADASAAGDIYRGETVYQRDCAGCHGAGGEGGVGPALFETGLAAAEVAAAVEQGGGVMPAGIVSGQEQVDVVTYVVSLSSPGS